MRRRREQETSSQANDRRETYVQRHRNSALDAGQLFRQYMKSLHWNTCLNCFKSFPSLVLINERCKSCDSSFKNGTEGIYTAGNNMNPQEVPPVLQDLSLTEELMIARIHPVLSVFRIQGQQFKYSGNVINFPQDVQGFAQSLPHNPANISGLVLVRKRESNTQEYQDFRVRSSTLLRALQWLKENNR